LLCQALVLWEGILFIVYGYNEPQNRRKLCPFGPYVSGPWLFKGDFNNILSYDDRWGRVPITQAEFEDFQSCLYDTWRSLDGKAVNIHE